MFSFCVSRKKIHVKGDEYILEEISVSGLKTLMSKLL